MEYIGLLATLVGIGTSCSFFPQTAKMIKRKSSKDISLLTYSILGVGAIIWLIYGITIGDVPLITSYTIGTISTFSVIVAYFVYR